MAYDLSEEEQKLRDFGASILPPWATRTLSSDETLKAQAAIWNRIQRQYEFWWDQSYISRAEGAQDNGPDYLDALAREYIASGRRADESNAELRQRIRTVEGVVTRPFVLAAINEILENAGISGEAVAVELRRDKGYFGDYDARTGTGGVFESMGGTVMKFTPTVAFERPVVVNFAGSGSWGNPRLVFASAEDAANDGTFEIIELSRNGAVFANAIGVANAADTTVTWSLRKYDVEGNNREGRNRAYFGRGYRLGGRAVVIILPYGSTAGTAAAVRESLRTRKPFGYRIIVEVRANP